MCVVCGVTYYTSVKCVRDSAAEQETTIAGGCEHNHHQCV
jgi:hypothetical protein